MGAVGCPQRGTNLRDIDGGATFLRKPDPEFNWLVPGLLERRDRLILTGNEGRGKSTLMRQLAAQISLGVHPITLDSFEPKKALFLDFENSESQTRRQFKALMPRWEEFTDRYLRLCINTESIDLLRPDDQRALWAILKDEKPDILLTGPLYKLSSNVVEDEPVSKLLAFMDELRATFDIAIIIETHEPHETIGPSREGITKYRAARPYGSSVQRRWPEFGFCLYDDGRFYAWRGQREERAWPVKFRRGVLTTDGGSDEWPWVVDNACLNCGKEVTGGRKYCDDKCADAFRHKRARSKKASKEEGWEPS